MGLIESCRGLTDKELLAGLERSAWAERRFAAASIAHLFEVEKRRLHLEQGYSSLFEFCTRALGYAEGSAYKRIQAARAAAEFPSLLDALAEGRVHMAAVVILRPHLTEENHCRLLAEAAGKSKREVERLAAALAPRPDIRDRVQRLFRHDAANSAVRVSVAPPLSEANAVSPSELAVIPEAPRSAPQAVEAITPLSRERIHFGFTGSEPLRKNIFRLKELLRHKFPFGRLEDILNEAAEFYLEHKDPDRRKTGRSAGTGRRGGAESRRVPQAVKDSVWRRDGGRCAFVSGSGRRCAARGGLEFDHIVPWALGGAFDSADNIRLLCRSHNQNEAVKRFGDRARIRRPIPPG